MFLSWRRIGDDADGRLVCHMFECGLNELEPITIIGSRLNCQPIDRTLMIGIDAMNACRWTRVTRESTS